MAIVTDTYSDHDMQCPSSWENGFKEGLVTRFGDGERQLSEWWTGEPKGATFDYEMSDLGTTPRRFREQLASVNDRYWVLPEQVKMTTRANRAILGNPYTVFVGPIVGIDPTRPQSAGQQHTGLGMRITLGDLISHTLLADDVQIPWRQIRDGFVNELDLIAESLDLDAPEPQIYGQHRRIPDFTGGSPPVFVPGDPASPQGFEWTPIYMGVEGSYHLWMVCGHACAAIPDVNVVDADGLHTSVLADGDWLIPHTSADEYEDRRSGTFGNDRRYTLIRGLVGNTEADACASGEMTLTCFVDGVEPVGDGSGAVITDRIQQYLHFLINNLAHRGPNSYQSGAWLTTPSWDLFDGPVPVIDEATFDACSAIGVFRLPLPEGSPVPDYAAGYIGAAIIGARASDRSGPRRWVADWNRSCGTRSGTSHFGQFGVHMLSPTEAIKAAATLYTDAYEILQNSFQVGFDWAGKVNRVPWRADPNHVSGQWATSDVFTNDAAVRNYGQSLDGDQREYPFAPGVTAANHLARLECLTRSEPLRLIRLEATVGPDYNNASLGYEDIGGYIRYQHFAGVNNERSEIRLAWIVNHQVQAGKRRVLVEAIDVEDLIDYDAPIIPLELETINDTCANAIVIDPDTTVYYTINIDTTLHADDPSVSGILGSPSPNYHAAWWSYTAPTLQVGHVTTGLSGYDTVLVRYEGDCGSLTIEEVNDNDVGVVKTSFIEFLPSTPLLPGVTYKFLVVGFTADEFGPLTFTFFAEPA